MKHAYLILAHTEFELLRLLVGCLDDVRNDIYIHFDKKVIDLPVIETAKSSLFIVKDRVDVRWGDYSVVEAEYKLFSAAAGNDHYAYYHLLSGVDLPLKSQNYIHRFFEDSNGKEFIGYTLTEITPEVVRKVQRWHLFPRDFRSAPIWKRALRAVFLRIQECVGYKRNKLIDFKKGSQWVSVTDGMVRCFLENEEWCRKVFTHTFCADEVYKHTICWMSPYRDKIYTTEEDGKGCMRAIGWRGSELVDWSVNDFDKLKKSDALFARKFNSKDMKFISKILELSKQ